MRGFWCQVPPSTHHAAGLGLLFVVDVKCISSDLNGTQPFNNLAGLVESAHMGVTGGEGAIRPREGRIFLDREAEFRRSLIEAPSGEMRAAYKEKCGADSGAGTEAKCGFRMLDRNVGLAPLDHEGVGRSLV